MNQTPPWAEQRWARPRPDFTFCFLSDGSVEKKRSVILEAMSNVDCVVGYSDEDSSSDHQDYAENTENGEEAVTAGSSEEQDEEQECDGSSCSDRAVQDESDSEASANSIALQEDDRNAEGSPEASDAGSAGTERTTPHGSDVEELVYVPGRSSLQQEVSAAPPNDRSEEREGAAGDPIAAARQSLTRVGPVADTSAHILHLRTLTFSGLQLLETSSRKRSRTEEDALVADVIKLAAYPSPASAPVHIHTRQR